MLLRPLLLAVTLVAPLPAEIGPQESDWASLKFTWSKPANPGHGASPVGNGAIGAKVTGGVARDLLQLNDKTFWSSDPQLFAAINDNAETNPAKRRAALVETRKLLAEAYAPDLAPAERDAKFLAASEAAYGMWGASTAATYLPVGQGVLTFPDHEKFTDYQRTLDLDAATVTTRYKVGGTTFTREVFASHPDGVIVVRLTSDGDRPFKVNAALELPIEMAEATDAAGAKIANNRVALDPDRREIVLTGTAPYDKDGNKSGGRWDPARGIRLEARLRVVVPADGKITPRDAGYAIETKSVVLLYGSATSYVDPFMNPNPGRDPGPVVRATLDAAAAKSPDALLAAHQADFRAQFRRLWIELGGETLALKHKTTPEQFAHHYQFARYIMLCVSRAGSSDRPHNQQGMWTHEWTPMSHCAHYLNENVQKMYGLIEAANLPGSGDPLWTWIGQLARNGAVSARGDWDFRGWLAPHNSDIWASTTLKGGRRYHGQNGASVWPLGGTWLMNNLFDHYAFSLDRAFLAAHYPVIQGAAEFALDYLVENADRLVSSPSTSPEHFFKVDGRDLAVDFATASDIELIRNLFAIVRRAAAALGKENDPLVREVAAANARLVPYAHYIDRAGQLQEFYNHAWYPVTDPTHRHNSHLLGVYPLNFAGFGPRLDPALWAAARKAWLARLPVGGQHPDRAAQGVRLGFPREALDNLPHGIYGAYGASDHFMPVAASIAEAILQSQNDEIALLPALPPEWKSGRVAGLRARGGFEIDLAWKNGALQVATLRSVTGELARVRHGAKTAEFTLAPGEAVTVDADLEPQP